MSLTADALRQLQRQKSHHSAPAADLITSFVTEQQTLHRRTGGQIPSSPPARPLLWEADDELPGTFQARVQNQPPWKDPGRASWQQHEHVTQHRETNQNHKRPRPASIDSSVLEQAALQNRAGESQDEDGIESVQEPEKIDRRRTVNYQKRSRYKMLDPGAGAARDRSPVRQLEKRKTTPQKKQTKAETKKRKSVSNALIDGFSPENIARRRITLNPSKSTGLYKETRIPPRPGLPDLSFSDMNFLRNRKHRPTFDLDVQDPADTRGRLRENNDEVVRFETTRLQRAQQRPGTEDVQRLADNASLQSPSLRERSASFESGHYRRSTFAETDDGRSEYSRTGVQTRFLPKAVSPEPSLHQRSRSHVTNTPPPDGDNADAERAERETVEQNKVTANAAEETVALPPQNTNQARLEHNLDEERPPSARKERSTSPFEQLLRMFPDEDDVRNHPSTDNEPLAHGGGEDAQQQENTRHHADEEDPVTQIYHALDLPSDEPTQRPRESTRGIQVTPNNYDQFDDHDQLHNYDQNRKQAYNTAYPTTDDDCRNVFYDDAQPARADQDQLYEEQEYNDEESLGQEEYEQTCTWLEDEPRYNHQTISETLHNAQDPSLAEVWQGHQRRPGLLLEYPPNRNGLNISHDDDIFEDPRFEKARSRGRLNDVNIEAGLEMDATTFWMPHRLH